MYKAENDKRREILQGEDAAATRAGKAREDEESRTEILISRICGWIVSS